MGYAFNISTIVGAFDPPAKNISSYTLSRTHNIVYTFDVIAVRIVVFV